MESITSYMEQDHVVIDGCLERALRAAGAGDTPALQREAGEFLRRLRRHIEVEEDVLFPAFEQRTGMAAAGPSRQMRIEHGMMRPVLAAMEQAVAVQDGAGFERAARSLLEVLEPHNVKEERMMYPMLDRATGGDALGLLQDARAMAA